jgi:hypothetical protein
VQSRVHVGISVPSQVHISTTPHGFEKQAQHSLLSNSMKPTGSRSAPSGPFQVADQPSSKWNLGHELESPRGLSMEDQQFASILWFPVWAPKTCRWIQMCRIPFDRRISLFCTCYYMDLNQTQPFASYYYLWLPFGRKMNSLVTGLCIIISWSRVGVRIRPSQCRGWVHWAIPLGNCSL